ncbi:hypothetical protein [Geobacter sp. AOG1]|uniref:hypothetical protein n=1 Tax=Geobacter sp. AOG1 TaxID=1566346 RepID=UPI001CC36BFC|nr:hypothetical protein [Geobacter sp. AOG1]GFE56453.1 hypothetical protein AOG1_03320 [Geobacter sp. AOG1]
MVVGFNHNVMYKGDVFHIQTEDSGVNNPHIITLLYRGGTIISSKKTSYADILKVNNLDQVVEELMKEQHKDMLRRLKAGEFDDRAFGGVSATPPPAAPTPRPAPSAAKPAAPQSAQSPAPAPKPAAPQSPPSASSQKAAPEAPRPKQSLDEIILDYLVAGDDK